MDPTVTLQATITHARPDPLDHLPATRRLVALVGLQRETGVPPLVFQLARRHGASVVLFDLSTGSRWTTPFEFDDEREEVEDRILSAPQLRALCHHGAADAVSALQAAGISAGAFLASRPAAVELGELVAYRSIDLVLVPAALSGRTRRNAELVRRQGAALVEIGPDAGFTVHPPLSIERMRGATTAARGKWRASWQRRVPLALH